MAILLKDLLNSSDIYNIEARFANLKIESIHYNSKDVVKNSIFVAIKGLKSDGYDYINSSIENGASVIVYDKNTKNKIDKTNSEICFIASQNTRRTLALLASNFYKRPTEKLNVVGVTGTNGKTTITYLIKSILEENNKKSTLIGTIKNIIDNKEIKTSLTTPESLELQEIFSLSLKNNVDTCVMEASSHALELKRCDYINYNAVIFTNITRDHLDYHENMENYLNAKLKIFDLLQLSKKENKKAIVNIHTDHFEKIKNYVENLNLELVTVGFNKHANYYAEIVSMDIKHTQYKLYVHGKYYSNIKLRLLGEFNVLNSLECLAYAFENNLDKDKTIKSIENIQVEGRFEIVTNANHSFIVAVDYSHTPDSLKNILLSAKALKPNRVIVVFGCGGDRDRTKRPLMAKVALEYSDIAIITLDNQRTENINQIMNDIEEGFSKYGNNENINKNFEYIKIIDRKLAIFHAIKIAEKNDIVIIAGKGHETYQILKDKTIHFDDRLVAREALSKL